MSKIRFFLDEDTIKAALIQTLRNADFDVVTVADVGRLGYADEEQLLWAIEQKRVIYSFNIGDFCRLHRDFMVQEISHTGIILVSQQLRGLLKVASQYSAEDMVNQLLFLSYYIEHNSY